MSNWKQEVFNQVVAQFAKQNWKPSASPEVEDAPFCRYRGPNNTKCAVGALISDEEYTSKFEGIGVSQYDFENSFQSKAHTKLYTLLQSKADQYNADFVEFLNFLEDLQSTHDECSRHGEDLKSVFQSYADNEGLAFNAS